MLEVAVRKRLGDFRLDVEIAVADFGITAFFGRSGSGKTSTVAAIAGLLRPDEGRVRIAGETLFDSAAGIDVAVHRRRIGYVFQEGRLFPHMSVRDNLLYGLRRAPPGERRIGEDDVVELLGLRALLARRPAQLSGGEKQRVAVGRALLAQPRALLMDEPLASLDAPRKREILPYIERLRDGMKLPIVYVSHAVEEVFRLANHVAIFEAGRVVASGTPGELSRRTELRFLLGEHDAGVLLDVEVVAHEPRYQLAVLRFRGGELRVPGVRVPVGAHLRVRVRERDVSLAAERPAAMSIQNILEGVVASVVEEAGALAEVVVDVGGTPIFARVTREAVHRLALAPGRRVYALVKSVSFEHVLDPADIT